MSQIAYYALIISSLLNITFAYDVPHPHIIAYSPKGLRVSIPDEREIKSVQFFFSFKRNVVGNEPGEVSKKVSDKDGSYWVYWNPSIELRPRDVIEYKIKVLNRGVFTAKEGTHIVDRLLSLADNSIVTGVNPADPDCDLTGQQQILQPNFPSTDSLEEHNYGMTGTKKLSQQSSYSMLKTVNSKPITRSSTIKTSGSYHLRPEGHVETSGYKESSSYDSTRPDGEQWQHSKSELSQAEIENLKLLHGFPTPEGLSSLPSSSSSSSGGVRGFHQETSYSSSTSHLKPIYSSLNNGQIASTSFVDTADLRPIRPPSYSSSVQTYEKQETLRPSHPVRPSTYSSTVQSFERQESSKAVPLVNNPITFSSNQNHQQEQQSYFPAISQPNHSNYQIKTEFEKHKSTSSLKNPVTYDLPKNPVEPAKPFQTSTLQKESNFQEFHLGPLKTVALSQPQIKYTGVIFTSPINPSPSSPQSCRVIDHGHRTASQIDVVELERTVNEVQCLAALAETTAREEADILKSNNRDLAKKLERLENEFKRFKEECRCRSF